jgi:hypothetical protein
MRKIKSFEKFKNFVSGHGLTYLQLCSATGSQRKQGVRHTVALPFTLKRILRKKKNYQNSNNPPCKNIVFTKSSKRDQNPSRYYNSVTNVMF